MECIFCNGTGKIDHFHHIEKGKCFRCNGTGKSKRAYQEKKDYRAKCYCGKAAFKTGDSCVSVSEYDNDDEIEYFFHNSKCLEKYMIDNKIDEMYTTYTTFV